MRNFITFIGLLIFLSSNISAQSFTNRQETTPIHWETFIEKQNDSVYHLIFKATIEDGWHLYSQDKVGSAGPVPTEFDFNESAGTYRLIGETKEPEGDALFDPVFGIPIKSFENEAVFVQPVKVNSEERVRVEAKVRFMLCDNYKCRAPETLTFEFSLNE